MSYLDKKKTPQRGVFWIKGIISFLLT